MKTAIFVDGAFYRKQAEYCLGKKTAKERADELEAYCKAHLNYIESEHAELQRVYYYDCEPMSAKVYHPYTKEEYDFSKTAVYEWTKKFFDELRKKRKFMLRYGKLNEKQAKYILGERALEQLLSGERSLEDLRAYDFKVQIPQKRVDMMIGLDIASLAYKQQCEQMILISGDSDFVPAAELARREGIDFILDPLGAYTAYDLREHIDGYRTCNEDFIKHGRDAQFSSAKVYVPHEVKEPAPKIEPEDDYLLDGETLLDDLRSLT